MLHINTVHVQRETLWVKQLAEEQYKMICSAWANIHILQIYYKYILHILQILYKLFSLILN